MFVFKVTRTFTTLNNNSAYIQLCTEISKHRSMERVASHVKPLSKFSVNYATLFRKILLSILNL